MRRTIVLLTTMVAAVVLAFGSAALAQRAEPRSSQPASAQSAQDFVPGEVLVKFKPGASRQNIADIHRQVGGQVKEVIGGIGVRVVGVARGQEKATVARYQQNPNVRYAELNGVYEPAGRLPRSVPSDPRFRGQWAFSNTGQTGGTADADIDADEAWSGGSTTNWKAGTTGSAAFPIAVLDTGINKDHEDLKDKVTKRINFACSTNRVPRPCPNSTTIDVNGHGTHVAGIVAARTDNEIGVAGTCPGCVLYNVKVLGDKGPGTAADVAKGIRWAADNGAKVINMSFGTTTLSRTVAGEVNRAWGKGAVLVAAAMNSGSSSPYYPAAYEKVIAVGATDSKDRKRSSSNYGSWVDVAAPGSNIYSTVIDNPDTASVEKYGPKSGTSMASPHVAGVAGLVWSKPGLCTSNLCVRNKIVSSIENRTVLSGTGPDWSKGRINACSAVCRNQQVIGGY